MTAGPNYFDALEYPKLVASYPLAADARDRFTSMSTDRLRALQDERFRTIMAFAWKVPFYQRQWGRVGLEPGDIQGLDDIVNLPIYSKADLMASVETHPPLGDFHGLDTYTIDRRPPVIMQTTSGTTGRPQPLLFGPKSREVQNILLARVYGLQGITQDDVVHSVYGHGMVNGGHYVRETFLHWVGAHYLSAGTGVETPSVNQVHLLRNFGATVIVGFGDYIKRLAEIARDEGIDPCKDLNIRIVSGHLGADDKQAMSNAWGGAEAYDWYGVGDTGLIAGELPDRCGLHIQEDAHYLELLDIEDGSPVEPGTMGNMVCTCLYKDDVFPIIRFQTHDVSRVLMGDNPTGMPFRRLEGFLGRSDNMVKLRGINVYPQGIGALLASEFAMMTGEYFCHVTRLDGRDDMKVIVEVTQHENGLGQTMERFLRTRLGVGVTVELTGKGGTAKTTQIETRQKPIRLVDDRSTT